MTDQEMDLLLREKDDLILPSSGFLESVMTHVQGEASTLPPIPFPWKRALPGLIGGVIVLIVLLMTTASTWHTLQFQSSQAIPLLLFCGRLGEVIPRTAALWASVAVMLSSLCLAGARRAGRIR